MGGEGSGMVTSSTHVSGGAGLHMGNMGMNQQIGMRHPMGMGMGQQMGMGYPQGQCMDVFPIVQQYKNNPQFKQYFSNMEMHSRYGVYMYCFKCRMDHPTRMSCQDFAGQVMMLHGNPGLMQNGGGMHGMGCGPMMPNPGMGMGCGNMGMGMGHGMNPGMSNGMGGGGCNGGFGNFH
ncbi:hypothetical protein SS50377_21408 [Spironucleus salmonicida]|uniref:Uncharacterized protein n=1 Tax=Spironucleus salmonicida TaxID=348837 RepID=V6LTI0_9EUKA|nr:hypothetical protein SS50377_21408 [Spironucleus salmonicida]|eukprot:EST47952.1 Hypothetical protein SS50377_11936 [Spironucleus salmonicida]